MFQRILVPLDGSERVERAIPVAAHLARIASGSIILVRIVEIPVEYWCHGNSWTEWTATLGNGEHR